MYQYGTGDFHLRLCIGKFPSRLCIGEVFEPEAISWCLCIDQKTTIRLCVSPIRNGVTISTT